MFEKKVKIQKFCSEDPPGWDITIVEWIACGAVELLVHPLRPRDHDGLARGFCESPSSKKGIFGRDGGEKAVVMF